MGYKKILDIKSHKADCLLYDQLNECCSALSETKCRGCKFYKSRSDIKARKELTMYYKWKLFHDYKNNTKIQHEKYEMLIQSGLVIDL
jgi:hypothetical protein